MRRTETRVFPAVPPTRLALFGVNIVTAAMTTTTKAFNVVLGVFLTFLAYKSKVLPTQDTVEECSI